MAEQMKPCPFCGGAPTCGWHGNEDGGSYEIACLSCGSTGHDAGRFISVHGTDEIECASAWNTRAQPAAVDVPEEESIERKAIRKIIEGVGHYLPPDGMSAKDFISLVIEAVDNSEINRVMS